MMTGIQNHPYVYLLAFSTICCILAAYIVWRRREKPGALAFFVTLVGYIIWTGTYALQWALTSLDAQVLWLSLTFFGVGLTAGGSLWFALDWTGRRAWMKPIRVALVGALCAAAGILAVTDPLHHFYYAALSQRSVGGFVVLDWERGPGFIIFGLLIPMIISALSLAILFRTWRQAQGLLRRQAAVFFGAGLLPYVSVFFAQTILRPDPFLDAPPVVACVYALVMIHGFYLLRLFDVIPVARDTLIESLDVGVIVFNTQNRIVDLNLTAQNFLGLSQIQADGIPLEEAFHGFPQIIAMAGRVLHASGAPLRRTERKGALQEEISIDDGFDTYLSVRIAPLLDLVGNPLGCLMTIQDITARKQTDDALRESERRYRLLAQNFTDVIWTMDLTGRYTYVSPSVQRMRGYTPEEVMSQGLENAITPESYLAIHDSLKTVREEIIAGKMVPDRTYEVEQPCKDGTTIWSEALVRVMYDDEGHPLGILGVTREISDRKKAAEALRQAKEAAEAASRAKTVFLASVSHELRTPLNAILGFSEILVQSPRLLPEERENVAIINHSGEHLLRLINDILDISKIEAGQIDLHLAPFDLFEVLTGLQELFRLRAEEKGIILRMNVDPSVPRKLLGDEGKLRQILINLLANAIKYTFRGSVMLWVRAQMEERKAYVHFDVSDTGTGIAEEDQERIFQPFVQVQEKQQGIEGTGLGLTISREFARLMGGDLIVSSDLGLGSCFTLNLPFTVSAEDGDGRTYRSARRALAIAAPPDQTLRVLIAGDAFEDCARFLRSLGLPGLELRSAADTRQVLRAWEQWRPHLLLIDLSMPGLDGSQTARTIASHAEGKGTAIVAIASDRQAASTENLPAAGFCDCIRKPFRESEFYRILETRLGLQLVYEPEPAFWAEDGCGPTTAQLPQHLLGELKQAALQADFNVLLDLEARVSTLDPAFGDIIKRAIDAFDYRKIVERIDEIGGMNG